MGWVQLMVSKGYKIVQNSTPLSLSSLKSTEIFSRTTDLQTVLNHLQCHGAVVSFPLADQIKCDYSNLFMLSKPSRGYPSSPGPEFPIFIFQSFTWNTWHSQTYRMLIHILPFTNYISDLYILQQEANPSSLQHYHLAHALHPEYFTKVLIPLLACLGHSLAFR